MSKVGEMSLCSVRNKILGFGRHHDLVNPLNVAVSRIVSDVFANDAP